MSNDIKYIVCVNPETGLEYALLFNDYVMHRVIGDSMRRVGHRVLSAGFTYEKDGSYYCHGRSISLQLESRPVQDARLVNLLKGRTQNDK